MESLDQIHNLSTVFSALYAPLPAKFLNALQYSRLVHNVPYKHCSLYAWKEKERKVKETERKGKALHHFRHRVSQ